MFPSFHNMIKTVNSQMLNEMQSRETHTYTNTQRHITIKLLKSNDKEKMLQVARKKKTYYIK